jgi:hypothetical protein
MNKKIKFKPETLIKKLRNLINENVVNFVQIGANDGVQHDLVNLITTEKDYGYFLEPIDESFSKLLNNKKNYKNSFFFKKAILPDIIENLDSMNLLFDCPDNMGASFGDINLSRIKEKINVETINVENFIVENKLRELDFLFCAAESLDHLIVIDFLKKLKPKVLRFKTCFWCNEDYELGLTDKSKIVIPSRKKIKQILEGYGYEVIDFLEDSEDKLEEIIAYKKEFSEIINDLQYSKYHPEEKNKSQEIKTSNNLDKIALVTVLFDYPNNYLPTFYNNALNFFKSENIHIVRLWNEITSNSLYDKLYHYKVIGLLKYLEDNILGKYEYVIFLDATDTNFISSPTDIIEKFEKFNCSVLLGAEYGLWPHTDFNHLYDNKPKFTDKFYLNSGTYIGYTDKIIFHLKDIIENKYRQGNDDQGRWAIQYLMNDDIKIDQECKIFFSTYLSKKDVVVNNDDVKLEKIEACIIHDNGPWGDETLKLTEILNKKKILI